jgi:hypothetical protein
MWAAASLGYGWIGHVENRPEIVYNGLRLHSDALKYLHNVLRHPEPESQPEVHEIMQLLVLYEVCLTNG